ncbi:ArsR/SmtB family transcription factor [Pengzhenrongella sicca]|uniref:Helix-turn-helix transcriptional regulator n=1 Tax=Pengzhenrongella sicca TaxID=2819238 RepID=A0A8A4ZJP8_9MICO|nr:metalloregulator ArsR/SmtB family transcription factor [Pengzhenrongella sicca]QTE30757.1 helix-turn-helix transcriptional regulator [Pengzhenrongella sicca]
MPHAAPGNDAPLNELKADLFKALGHPVRVRTLELLAAGELPVSRLLIETRTEASNLSQHLSVLRRAGVVAARREGNAVHYRLADTAVSPLLAAAQAVLVRTLSANRAVLDGLDGLAGITTPGVPGLPVAPGAPGPEPAAHRRTAYRSLPA